MIFYYKMQLNISFFTFLSKRLNPPSVWGKVGMALLGFLFLFLVPCAGVSKSELSRAKAIAMSKEQFAANPFGFELTLRNFENHYYKKVLKRQRYFIQNMVNSSQTDTIYRYYKGKTKILFYKPMRLEAKIMGGVIRKPEVELKNEIRVGLSRNEFFWKFTDWLYDESDSLTLESPATGCSFTFVFSRDKLKEIQIAGKQNRNEKSLMGK